VYVLNKKETHVNLFKVMLAAGTILGGPFALAQVINCTTVGQIALNGDQADITYNAKMKFQDSQDTASFISTSETSTVYQANKWGAYIEIPNALLNGQVKQADVRFVVNQSDDFYDVCTSK